MSQVANVQDELMTTTLGSFLAFNSQYQLTSELNWAETEYDPYLTLVFILMVLCDLWRAVFQVTIGSGISAYPLSYSSGPALNEEASIECGGNYKSEVVDIWSGY